MSDKGTETVISPRQALEHLVIRIRSSTGAWTYLQGTLAYTNALRVLDAQAGDDSHDAAPAINFGETMVRDLFAASALTGLLAADAAFGRGPRWSESVHEVHQPGGGNWMNPEGVAGKAYELADAMLRERAKKPAP